jgi:hypothetical protein
MARDLALIGALSAFLLVLCTGSDARAQLTTCACKTAATAMTKPPCYNVSNKPNTPPQCASALKLLDACA